MRNRFGAIIGISILAVAAFVAVPTFAQYGAQRDAQPYGGRSSQRSGQMDLGPAIFVREYASEGVHMGFWVRRGSSNVYDMTAVLASNGSKNADVLEVLGVRDGQLTIRRRGNQGTYTLNLASGRGKASWVSDSRYYWEIVR